MKRSFLLLSAGVFLMSSHLVAEPPRWSITLPQIIDATFASSLELREAESNAIAAEEQAKSDRGRMWPALAVEGSVRRVSKIPELAFPGGQRISFTDNETYSIGPSLHYALFRGGADYFGWKAGQAIARSRRTEEQLIRRQRRLAAQLAYFQAQLAAEQVRLLVESYKVEERQHQDIQDRFAAGAAARTDLLASHQQTLNRRRQLLDARSDLAVALREVTRLTGLGSDVNPQLPLDGQTKRPLPSNVDEASVVLDIAAPASTVNDLATLYDANFDTSQPGIVFLTGLVEASELAAKSLQGARWPELTVLARTSWDYPNGPIRETVHQNTLGASLNFPLFTGGELYYGVRAKNAEAKAVEQQRDQAARDLLASYLKARDQANALRAQRPLNDVTILESQELAQLQYQSYRAGRARYLDVQDANLKVLQARTAAAQTDVRLLIQLATIESLSDASN